MTTAKSARFAALLVLSALIGSGNGLRPIGRRRKIGSLSSVVTSGNNDIGASASCVLRLPRGGGRTKPPPPSSAPTSPPPPCRVPSGATSSGTASTSAEIFNLVKSIVAAGVLGLPAGIAAFGDAPTALLPAFLLVCLVGAASGYGFVLIGRSCAYTGATSYREAWERTVGAESSWMPAAACTAVTTCSVLSYSMILADTFKNLLIGAGFTGTSRSRALLLVTCTVLLPLCFLKDMSSLAPFSLVGILGMAYTSLAMALRYFDGTYALPDGAFVSGGAASASSPDLLPQFGTKGASAVFSPNAFLFVSMLCTAYMAHYNAPKFYVELQDNTLPRFNAVVLSSFVLSVLLFAAIAGLGFLTFGGNAAGLVLNNYAPSDPVMSLSRLAVAASLICSYPLAFVGVRDGVLDLAGVPDYRRTDRFLNVLTVVAVSAVTALALAVKDLSFVLAFGGSTWGAALIYVFPAVMFRAAVRRMEEEGEDVPPGLRGEVKLAMGKAVLGTALGCIGTKMALKKLQ